VSGRGTRGAIPMDMLTNDELFDELLAKKASKS
jgi:hypothetical protein